MSRERNTEAPSARSCSRIVIFLPSYKFFGQPRKIKRFFRRQTPTRSEGAKIAFLSLDLFAFRAIILDTRTGAVKGPDPTPGGHRKKGPQKPICHQGKKIALRSPCQQSDADSRLAAQVRDNISEFSAIARDAFYRFETDSGLSLSPLE